MPRGVYPRKPKSEPTPSANGAHDVVDYDEPTIEDYDDIPPAAPTKIAQPWGQPYETAAADLEAQPSAWEDLYQDAFLRLEKTPASKAIIYPFADHHLVKRAYNAVSGRFRERNGAGFAICGTRDTPPQVLCSAWAELQERLI